MNVWMSLSSVIDTICSYLNSLSSLFSTVQRLKNEFHAKDIDYTAVLVRLLVQPRVDPARLGESRPSVDEGDCVVLISALISLAVYSSGSVPDWTLALTPVLRSRVPGMQRDPWRRGRLRPVVVDLHESHYMTSSKAHVYMAASRHLDCIVLSLPGTNSRSDWLSNMHSSTSDMTINGETYKVHEGFLYIARCLITHKVIRRYLGDAIAAGFSKVLLCGHSQAGAVVSLLSVLLEAEYRLETQVVTFGSGACVRAPHVRMDRCTSFIRCVESHGPALQKWQIDPVPLLDEALLSEDDSAAMHPFGLVVTLLDSGGSACVSRQLERGQLRKLLNGVLLNFSADPHSMKGYLRCILSQGSEDLDSLGELSEHDSAHSPLLDLARQFDDTDESDVETTDNDDDDAAALRQLTTSTRSRAAKRRKT